jgi:hypothetical protein
MASGAQHALEHAREAVLEVDLVAHGERIPEADDALDAGRLLVRELAVGAQPLRVDAEPDGHVGRLVAVDGAGLVDAEPERPLHHPPRELGLRAERDSHDRLAQQAARGRRDQEAELNPQVTPLNTEPSGR